jgi:hypothetical protein
MSEKEKLALAEEFVRKAVAHLSSPVSKKVIWAAAKKAAESLPPFASTSKAA